MKQTRLKKLSNYNAFVSLINSGSIDDGTILNIFNREAESWGEEYSGNIDVQDPDYKIPEAYELMSKFVDDMNMYNVFDKIFEGNIDPECFEQISDEGIEDIVKLIINKYDIETNDDIIETFEGVSEGIYEVVREGRDQDNYPWGPGMSQHDFI